MKRFHACLIAGALFGLPMSAWAQSGGQCDIWLKRTQTQAGCWQLDYATGFSPVAPGARLPAPRLPPPAGYTTASGYTGLHSMDQCKAFTANTAKVAHNQYSATQCVTVNHDGVKIYSRP